METVSCDTPSDDERLYQLIQQEAWGEALRWLHRAWRQFEGDARARRAAEIFDEAFLEDLEARPLEALEQRLMLHHGRMRTLPEAEYDRLTGALARRVEAAGDEEAVRSLARLAADEGTSAPEVPAGRDAQRDEVEHEETTLRLTRIRPVEEGIDARSSLFKSEQERLFFEALRRVFPTYQVYPNAALSATLDFEGISDRLTRAERQYFFRALVDAVVVDPLDALRPVYFFELDSTHHDAPERRRNDRLKEAILTKAGQTLFRLRRRSGDASAEAFARAVRSVVEGK